MCKHCQHWACRPLNQAVDSPLCWANVHFTDWQFATGSGNRRFKSTQQWMNNLVTHPNIAPKLNRAASDIINGQSVY